MPLIIVLSLALQFFCLVHMVRSGRPYWWAFIIMIGSFLGAGVYLLTQVLPEASQSRTARRAVRGLQQAIDPERERRRIEAELAVADTVQNRLRLARECLDLRDPFNAEPLFESCLKGPHANDPDILLGLAEAQFLRGDAAATRTTLERLIAANPEFRSHDGHLLYAQALQAQGELDAAEHEYEALEPGFPGEEARIRYAQLLQSRGKAEAARVLFERTRARAKVAPAHYRSSNREWIEQAEAALRTS